MNTAALELIARELDKAKLGGSGPQALADWANSYGASLIQDLKVREEANENPIDYLAPLRPLYPTIGDGALIQYAAGDIEALRKDRAKRAGVLEATANEIVDRILDAGPAEFAADPQSGRLIKALRPFAAMGAPLTLETIQEAAIAQGVEWDGVSVFTVADTDGVIVASINRDQAEAAHALINEIDQVGGK